MEKTLCLNCNNYYAGFKCSAFPARIPNEILTGKDNHSKPLKDQKNKIVFEKIETKL